MYKKNRIRDGLEVFVDYVSGSMWVKRVYKSSISPKWSVRLKIGVSRWFLGGILGGVVILGLYHEFSDDALTTLGISLGSI